MQRDKAARGGFQKKLDFVLPLHPTFPAIHGTLELETDARDQSALQQSLGQGFSPTLIAFGGQNQDEAGGFSHGLNGGINDTEPDRQRNRSASLPTISTPAGGDGRRSSSRCRKRSRREN